MSHIFGGLCYPGWVVSGMDEVQALQRDWKEWSLEMSIKLGEIGNVGNLSKHINVKAVQGLHEKFSSTARLQSYKVVTSPSARNP